MASFVRRGVVVLSLGIFLFYTSCEKHPVGQLPELQREQPDPAKVWSNATEHSEEHSTSETAAEVPHEAR